MNPPDPPPGAAAPRRRGRPPEADAAETRAKILKAAREVFSSTGYDRATMDQIATAVGLTRAGIRNYYLNKIELHHAAFTSIENDAIAKIMVGLPGPGASTTDRVMAMFHGAIDFNEADRTLVRFWVNATIDGVHHSEMAAQVDRLVNQLRSYFEEVVREGLQRGELTPDLDPVDTAHLLMDLLWGLAIDGGFRSEPKKMRRILNSLDTILARALPREAGGELPAVAPEHVDDQPS